MDEKPPIVRIPAAAAQGYAIQANLFEQRRGLAQSFVHAVVATAIFRCWHILLFFGAWSTAICVISATIHDLSIQTTLITVLGTVLGFVVSYRTTSSFERYNEGRKYWSQIVLASRTFARTAWFNIPETYAPGPNDPAKGLSPPELAARVIMEKKTMINLVQAFAVAVKHYLRGEDGIHYVDLYHLVKFLPSYALPTGLPTPNEAAVGSSASVNNATPTMHRVTSRASRISSGYLSHNGVPTSPAGRPRHNSSASAGSLPYPVSVGPPSSPRKPGFLPSLSPFVEQSAHPNPVNTAGSGKGTASIMSEEEIILLPARIPPKAHLFDIFPFSIITHIWTREGKEVKGKKAARLRAKLRNQEGLEVTHNVPLEISMYLGSYVAAIQNRKCTDVPTINSLTASLNQLVDALTGLERILTTPIPFSYSVHLWSVAAIYNLALPFQLWGIFKWITIPASVICAFIFFGFLVAGEEIENPFGYDKNDLNMDHFTHAIIRNELLAITSTPPPDPAHWVFSKQNDLALSALSEQFEKVTPDEWVKRGTEAMMYQLST